jgi:hypothetical protein
MDEQSRIARRLTWGVAAALFLLGAAGAILWVAGRTVWTDGQSTRVAAADARLREALWAVPKPLETDLNSADQQYEPSLSPDGTELYFVRGKPGRGAHIYVSYRRDNTWTPPAPVDAVKGPTDDLGPRVTHDGRFLIFSSDRPGGLGGYDLWAAPREQGGWGLPFNLGPGVNTEFNELNPDPTPDGRRLIFSTNRKAARREQAQAWRGTIREAGSGDYDLWIATLDRDAAAPATHPTSAPATRSAAAAGSAALTFKGAAEIPGVNTSSSEGASCMSPAGDFLYFASNRPGGFGKFDIYRCRVRDGDPFGPVENLGRPINTPDNEADPSMAMAGFRIYFSSDRNSPGGVYTLHTADSREVFALRETRPLPHLGWSVWSLLLSALLLIPLILALRGIEGRHLNTLQRCLVLSLLLHAALTFLLSFVLVSRDVSRAIGRGPGDEFALNLNLSRDVEIGLAVRGQLSSQSELPVAAAEPAPVARAARATQTDRPMSVQVTAPANSQSPTDAPPPFLPDVTIAAKPTVPTGLPTAAPVAPTAITNAAAPLSNVGPHDPVEKFAQPAADALVAAEGQPRLVRQREVDAAHEMRLLRDLSSEIPKASASTARAAVVAAAPFDPSAAGMLNRALPGDGSAVAPRALTPVAPSDLRIAGLPTQHATAPRLNPEAPPALPPAEAPPTLARPLATAARDALGAPADVDPIATPIRPTTVPTAVAFATAPSTRPAQLRAPETAIGVRPASATTATPALALLPSPPLGPVATDARLPSSDAATDPPRGPEVASHLVRQGTAGAPAAAPAHLTSLARFPAAAPPQNSAAYAPVIASTPAPRALVETAGDPVSPLAIRPPVPVEIPPAAVPAPAPSPAIPMQSVGSTSRQNTDPDPPHNDIALVLASQRAAAAETPPAAPPIASAATASPVSPDQAGLVPHLSDLGNSPTPQLSIPSTPTPVNPATRLAAAVPLSLPPPPGVTAAPPSPFPRSPEQRQPRIDKLGGSPQSEAAVDRGLAYLATQQQPDGRWTLVLDDGRSPARRPKSYHDMANTGLATLAFLARDNAPGKPGPYSKAVAKALDYLIDQQDDDGDLRGPPELRGEGSRRGDMYDHAIATLALAEAALMTAGDKRYADAALRGAAFIVRAQDARTGGWRYVPGEAGDSSVFGWQVMALHAAEQLGFQTPDATRQLARRYVRLASQGPRRMLAGYQPGKPATPTMTAEILYGRMLVGQKLEADDITEATEFLTSQPPDPREPSLYYWYYASLCMLQIQNADWERWNVRTRDALIALQTRGGPDDGSWDADPRYAERGGRIYMTSIAVLTLEVYYRYLPLLDRPTSLPQ